MSLKKQIIEAASDDLEQIEAALEANLTPYLDLVRDVAGHILFSGGKRLRPLLMVLSARMCGYTGDKAFDIAGLFEYLHAATLLHDDLVDDADTRRGKPAAHTVWDNPTAVLTGDYLLSRVLYLATVTGDLKIIRVIANMTGDLSQGEIHQLMNKGDINLTESQYLKVIERKTAVLIQGACRTGALLANASQEKEEALDRYGYHMGVAFQMADDLLDYTAESDVLGKTKGADLREGKLTLPVIHTLAHTGKKDREAVVAALKNPDFSDTEFENVKDIITRCGGIDYTVQQANIHVASARKQLDLFSAGPAKDTLWLLAGYALERDM